VNPGEQALTVVMPTSKVSAISFGDKPFASSEVGVRSVAIQSSDPSCGTSAGIARAHLFTWQTTVAVSYMAFSLGTIDFFTVPTATFRILFVFVALSHERRRVMHFGVTEQKLQDAVNDRLGISVARENA
jgi:hypothetical protein